MIEYITYMEYYPLPMKILIKTTLYGVIGVALVIIFVIGYTAFHFKTGTWIIPSQVTIFPGTEIKNNKRILLLSLYPEQPECGSSASALQTETSFTKDTLTVTAKGYRMYSRNLSGACIPEDTPVDSAVIYFNSNWIQDKATKNIVVTLAGQTNTFTLSRDGYKITVKKIQNTNVQLNKNKNEVIGYWWPKDVGRLWLMDTLNSPNAPDFDDSVYPEYETLLRKVAQEYGFIPVEQAYPGAYQPDIKKGLYVVVKNRDIPVGNERIGGEYSVPNNPQRKDISIWLQSVE